MLPSGEGLFIIPEFPAVHVVNANVPEERTQVFYSKRNSMNHQMIAQIFS